MDLMLNFYRRSMKDSLFRNSLFLMMSTGVMAFFGFFFWIINARLFSPEQVGLGTTLVSVATLISRFSLLGMGNSLIKYLSSSERKNEKINTTFTLVGLVSLGGVVVYLAGLASFSPKLLFIRESRLFAGTFIVFTVFYSLNIFLESVFIAYRSAKYVFIKNLVWSLAKLLLPFALLTLGAYGIFAAVGTASVVAFLLGLMILVWKFSYRVKPVINIQVVKRMFKFSMGNYVAGFVGDLPQMVLPILITNSIGARYSAYFYMDIMIANFLYIIPQAVSQSLFAEVSNAENELNTHEKKAIRIIVILILPAILAITIGGSYLLKVFGHGYSDDGVGLLRLLAISSVFIAINNIRSARLLARKQVGKIIILNILLAAIILPLSAALFKLGLTGVGVAWLVGQGIVSLAYLL